MTGSNVSYNDIDLIINILSFIINILFFHVFLLTLNGSITFPYLIIFVLQQFTEVA